MALESAATRSGPCGVITVAWSSATAARAVASWAVWSVAVRLLGLAVAMTCSCPRWCSVVGYPGRIIPDHGTVSA
jgi:hypothetical protein